MNKLERQKERYRDRKRDREPKRYLENPNNRQTW